RCAHNSGVLLAAARCADATKEVAQAHGWHSVGEASAPTECHPWAWASMWLPSPHFDVAHAARVPGLADPRFDAAIALGQRYVRKRHGGRICLEPFAEKLIAVAEVHNAGLDVIGHVHGHVEARGFEHVDEPMPL